MESLHRNGPGFRYHLKVHVFRMLTAMLAWGLIAIAFYRKPELLTSAQSLVQRGVEVIGGAIPSPWGPSAESVFRETGGVLWLQITMVILAIRMTLSGIAATWRLTFRPTGSSRTGPGSPRRMSDPVALTVYAVLTSCFFGLLILVLNQ